MPTKTCELEWAFWLGRLVEIAGCCGRSAACPRPSSTQSRRATISTAVVLTSTGGRPLVAWIDALGGR